MSAQATGANRTPTAAYPPSLVAFWEDGRLYGGDLISDVIDYRDLRAESLAGGCFTSESVMRLADLEQRLRTQGAANGRRNYRRFACNHRGHIVRPMGDQIEILDARIVDLGGGGAKLELDDELQPGEQVTLVLRNVDHTGETLRVTFHCRVAWNLDHAAGLMFAGPPTALRPQ